MLLGLRNPTSHVYQLMFTHRYFDFFPRNTVDLNLRTELLRLRTRPGATSGTLGGVRSQFEAACLSLALTCRKRWYLDQTAIDYHGAQFSITAASIPGLHSTLRTPGPSR